MTAKEEHERALVVAETRTWLCAPYSHRGRSKTGGVDCVCLLAEVFERSGVMPHIDLPMYPMDWAIHSDHSILLDILEKYAVKVSRPRPLPGDIAVFMAGKCESHAALVIEYPMAIHAWNRQSSNAVEWVDITQGWCAAKHADGLPRLRGFWSFKGWEWSE